MSYAMTEPRSEPAAADDAPAREATKVLAHGVIHPEAGRVEAIGARIQEAAASSFDDSLTGALTTLLSSLEEQSQQSVAQVTVGNRRKVRFSASAK